MEKPEKNKLRQKDLDAAWPRKGDETLYGYKDHVKADADSKLITKPATTTVSTHNSQSMPEMINETNNVVYVGSAYCGKPVAGKLPQNVINRIMKAAQKRVLCRRINRKTIEGNPHFAIGLAHLWVYDQWHNPGDLQSRVIELNIQSFPV